MTLFKAVKPSTTLLVFALAFLSLVSLFLFTVQAQTAPNAAEQVAGGAYCDPLPAPGGNVISVTPAQDRELDDIIAGAAVGDTILLADGTYELEGDYLYITTPGITVRSASGNREAVILDGGYQTTEIFLIAASDVTIADLTVQRAYYHPIHITGGAGSDTENSLIYNVRVLDPGQQAIKINANGAQTYFADNGVIACSHIELTDAGRPKIWEVNGSCYTGGIDAHRAEGWVVRDNVITGFWCENGLSEHAIHFWTGSKDTLVARNHLIDNARGVGFGLGQSGDWRTYVGHTCGTANIGHYDGIIRNNFIFQGRVELYASQSSFECGVCLEQACGAQVFHNSVVATQPPALSGIEWRFGNTSAEIRNNLLSHNLLARNGATAVLSGNIQNASLANFVDGSGGDLHLAASAGSVIDQGAPIGAGMSANDIDGDPRDAAPDVGADEFVTPTHFFVFAPIILKDE